MKNSQPLVSDKEPIEVVIAEYSGVATDDEFKVKAKVCNCLYLLIRLACFATQSLAARFKQLRRVRGDGNCFYRAMLFALCERFTTDKALAEKYIGFLFDREILQTFEISQVYG